MHLFQYVQNNKEADNDWFRLESNKEGTRWFGKCWYIHELLKYEFDVEFDVSLTIMFQLAFSLVWKFVLTFLRRNVCLKCWNFSFCGVWISRKAFQNWVFLLVFKNFSCLFHTSLNIYSLTVTVSLQSHIVCKFLHKFPSVF